MDRYACAGQRDRRAHQRVQRADRSSEFDLETIMSDGGVLLHEGDDEDLDDYLSWYLYPVETYLSSYIDDNYKLKVTDESKPRLFYLGSEIDYYNNSVFVKQD